MKAGILFSGGKDSSLAAILLSSWYEVELNTFLFSRDTRIPEVIQAANALGFPHHCRFFRDGLLDEVIDLILRDGFPNNAIQMVHREAIRCMCEWYGAVADGTRFGDRVPLLSDNEIRSLGDRYGCSYMRPLIGLPKREVERLVSLTLMITYGETGSIRNGDYEHEIRQELQNRGYSPGDYFPPVHSQSLTTGRLKRTSVNYEQTYEMPEDPALKEDPAEPQGSPVGYGKDQQSSCRPSTASQLEEKHP